MTNIQPSQVNLEAGRKKYPWQRPFPSILSWSPSQDVPTPVPHLCCQAPLQHGRNGPLQHLFATILKWNGKKRITLGHMKRTPEEMIHPVAGLCLTASPSQRWSGPGSAGCRAAWGEKGLGASEEGPHTSLLLLFTGEDAPSPLLTSRPWELPWPHSLEQRSGIAWGQGYPSASAWGLPMAHTHLPPCSCRGSPSPLCRGLCWS